MSVTSSLSAPAAGVAPAPAIFGSSIVRIFLLLTLLSAGSYLVADMLSAPRICMGEMTNQ